MAGIEALAAWQPAPRARITLGPGLGFAAFGGSTNDVGSARNILQPEHSTYSVGLLTVGAELATW